MLKSSNTSNIEIINNNICGKVTNYKLNSCHEKCDEKCDEKCENEFEADFIIVGAGNSGPTLANRLSENRNVKVILIECGRDEARLPLLLPLPSPANVPQPGDFSWGGYIRNVGLRYSLDSRGFSSQWFWLKSKPSVNSPIVSYPRQYTWSGCTAHNSAISIRNPPTNWDSWGLPKWTFSQVQPYFFKVENRSQVNAAGSPYYTLARPIGTQGSFNPAYYGYDGYVPLYYNQALAASTGVVGNFYNDFISFIQNDLNASGYSIPLPNVSSSTAVISSVVPGATNTTINVSSGSIPANGSVAVISGVTGTGDINGVNASWNISNVTASSFTIPVILTGSYTSGGTISFNTAPFGLVDLDNPPTAPQGGASFYNSTQTDQTGQIVPPGQPALVPFATYNFPLYGDAGYVYPPELAPFGLTGLAPTQRANSVNTYLYPVLNRPNLKVISEAFVVRLLDRYNKCSGRYQITGIEYVINGYNVYQGGRNPNIEKGGYGGTPGDAKANSLLNNKLVKIFAKKEVILSAGFINTPQLMMLSGYGNKADLEPLGIKVKVNIPGVGYNMVDNQEIIPTFKNGPNVTAPSGGLAFAVKSNPSLPYANFNINTVGGSSQVLETADVTVQRNWLQTQNLPGLDVTFIRNNPDNILIDPILAKNPYVPSAATFNPVSYNPAHFTGCIIELEDNNRSRGYIKLLSKDPFMPPQLIGNYLTDTQGPGGTSQDLQDFVDFFMNIYFPMLLYHGYTTQALATPNIVGGQITSYTMTNSGSGYSVPPVVTIGPDSTGASSATAVAVVNGGSVNVYPVKLGSNYASASFTGQISGNTLNVSGVTGTIYVGQALTGSSIPAGTLITSGSGTTWKLNKNLDVASESMTSGPSVTIGSYFDGLINPAPYEVLVDGVVIFNNINQIDQTKLRAWIQKRIGGHHAGGTTKMGLPNDANAVCDQDGLVMAVDGLRVGDMSLAVVSFWWPNITLYTMLEKIADAVKAKWNI
jgi:choline dehydrogenase-like flavoprotein